MNPFHRVPPVWSPVSANAIWAGWRARHDGGALESLKTSLREEYSAEDVALTASGTAALTAAIRLAAPPGERPVVALPAYACYDLATAADGAAARVRLYDLDPATLGPNRQSFTAALENGVNVVVFAHLFGVPVAPSWFELARAAGAAVIDDAAQGVGGSTNGRPLGSLGDLGVLSFGRGKGRTGGGGGALLLTSDRLASRWPDLEHLTEGESEKASRLALALAAQWILARPSLYQVPASIPWLKLGETIYHRPSPIRSMAAFSAGVLEAAKSFIAAESQRRWATGDRLHRELGSAPQLTRVEIDPEARPGWLRFPVIVSAAVRAAFASERMRRLGVMPGYPIPLGRLPGFTGRIEGATDFRGATELAARLFTLPTHRWADEQHLMSKALNSSSGSSSTSVSE